MMGQPPIFGHEDSSGEQSALYPIIRPSSFKTTVDCHGFMSSSWTFYEKGIEGYVPSRSMTTSFFSISMPFSIFMSSSLPTSSSITPIYCSISLSRKEGLEGLSPSSPCALNFVFLVERSSTRGGELVLQRAFSVESIFLHYSRRKIEYLISCQIRQ